MEVCKQSEVTAEKLADYINAGEVLVLPTETAYGLIADATNRQAVEKVFAIKGRTEEKPLPVVCYSRNQVREFFSIPSIYNEVIKQHWPGPLSVLLHPKDSTVQVNPQGLFDNTVAVRVTSFHLLRDLAQRVGKPLVATSANVAGDATPYSIHEVEQSFTKATAQPTLLVDAGTIPKVTPSTIIGVDNGMIITLRTGPIDIS